MRAAHDVTTISARAGDEPWSMSASVELGIPPVRELTPIGQRTE